jgi:flagellar FliL protein
MAKDKDKDKAESEKPKGGMMKMVLVAVVMLGIGGGGAYGAFAAGLLGSGDGHEEADVPALVRKGETDPYAPATDSHDKQPHVVHGEGGSEYRTAYYSFEEPFTTNLADSPALIQVEIAVSTEHDGRVLQWVESHKLAIRSAILVQLASTSEGEVYSVEGKEELGKRLTASINEVLEEHEGFGGIKAVHFKGFLVQ